MKKLYSFFVGLLSLAVFETAADAVTIKKAAPVAKQEVAVSDATTSLIPSVINLIAGVQTLNKEQNALVQECRPTSREISFVNEMIKEWAKTGEMSADSIKNKFNVCKGTESYKTSVQLAADLGDFKQVCFDSFNTDYDRNNVWYEFPKASEASYCAGGEITCRGEEKYMSNIYDIFMLIDFADEDYTADELKMASALMEKSVKCAPSKLNARKLAKWGEFLMSSIGSIGQPVSTDVIMQQVANTVGASGGALGNIGGILQSFGGMAGQFMN